MNKLLFLLSFYILNSGFSQVEDTLLPRTHIKPIEVTDKNFAKEYRYLKPRVIKVYPYAMYAANLLDELEKDLASIEKRRKRNKHCRISYKDLKEDFKYTMLDLYISEGKVLMNLIARETGSTVYDIIKKYRGVDDAAVFNLMGKMFEQDIKAPYIKSEHYVLEFIIREIEAGKILIDTDPKLVTKEDYKAEEARLKANKKKYKLQQRKQKQQAKKAKKLQRKGKRQAKKEGH
jgi:hypothetical protein